MADWSLVFTSPRRVHRKAISRCELACSLGVSLGRGATVGVNRLLILKAPTIQEDLHKLLERLESDPGLRRLYLNDPAGVIQKLVFPDQQAVPSAEINRGNRLLYAILTNEAFLQWARDYEERLISEAREATQIEDPARALNAYLTIMDRSRIHQDLADAVGRTADAEMIAALTWRPDLPRVGNARLPIAADVAVDIETFIYAVAVAAAFAVAFAAVFFAAPIPARADQVVSRIDVQAVANQLNDALAQRAGEVRASGVLTQFRMRNVGFTR
jgi:hypothetical protein